MVWCGILWVAVVWQGRVSHFTALFTAWWLRHSCDMHSSVEPDTPVIVVLCYSDMYSTSWCNLHSSVEEPADSPAKVGYCREFLLLRHQPLHRSSKFCHYSHHRKRLIEGNISHLILILVTTNSKYPGALPSHSTSSLKSGLLWDSVSNFDPAVKWDSCQIPR